MASSAKKTTKSKKTTSATKKPAPKKVNTKKVVETTKPHFTHDVLDTKTVAHVKKSDTDTSMFTTLLALFIVAFVVLGGFVYSRQAHKTDILSENLAFP